MRRVVIALLSAAFIGILAWSEIPTQAQSTFPNPVVTVTTLSGTTGQQIVAANGSRRSIRICNTDATNAMWIWPGTSLTLTSDTILAPVTSNVASCLTPPNGVVGSAGAQWNAVAIGNGAGHASVEEW